MESKKSINFRFTLLLCIAFFFQHLSFATHQKTEVFSNPQFGVSQNSYFEKANPANHELQLCFFVEAESEDEDDIHNEQEIKNANISSNQNFISVHDTDIFSKLFSKLATTNQHKVDLPFFILYHSWKSHLA